MWKSIGLMLAGLIAAASSAAAGDLVYSPVNPSFGGSPLNSAHLLGLANAQREATASDFKKDDGRDGTGSGTGNGGAANSDADLFVRQLQGRLLSALAGQVTDAIFGDNPQDNGTVQFGDTTVTFERTADSIKLTIVNALDGTVTEIVVPQLVAISDTDTTRNSQSNAAPGSLASAPMSGLSSMATSRAISGALQDSNASGIY